jgi:hypothetical protein
VSRRGRTVVVTASGLYTSMVWWFQLKVEESSVVVRGPSEGKETWGSLLLAACGSVDDARALFELISERLKTGAPVCDVRRLMRSLEDGASGVVVEMQRTT